MTRDEAIGLAALMHAYWPRWALPEVDAEVDFTLGAWCRLCEDLPGPAMIAAVDDLCAQGETYPPSIGEIRQRAVALLAAVSGDRVVDVDEAWAEVQRAVNSRGFRAGPGGWSHPAIADAVDAIGWWRLCYDENQGTLFAQFRDVYRPAAVRSVRTQATPQTSIDLVKDVAALMRSRARELTE